LSLQLITALHSTRKKTGKHFCNKKCKKS